MRNLFGPFLWIFMALGTFAFLIISLLIAKYLHKDAIRRGIKNSEFWLLMGLIFNVLGLLVYILVRNNYNEAPTAIKPK
jgi:Kef-type K+ transport system membrane component KefB